VAVRLPVLKAKCKNQRDAEKSEKEDQSGFKNFFVLD
jgi:hypothetical protein